MFTNLYSVYQNFCKLQIRFHRQFDELGILTLTFEAEARLNNI
jgi:hypothetical protein